MIDKELIQLEIEVEIMKSIRASLLKVEKKLEYELNHYQRRGNNG